MYVCVCLCVFSSYFYYQKRYKERATDRTRKDKDPLRADLVVGVERGEEPPGVAHHGDPEGVRAHQSLHLVGVEAGVRYEHVRALPGGEEPWGGLGDRGTRRKKGKDEKQ